MPINLDFDQDAAYKTMQALCKIGPRVSGSEAEIRAILLIEERFRNAGLSDILIHGHEHQFYEANRATFGTPDDDLLIEGVPCWMSASTPLNGIESESLYIATHERVGSLELDVVKNKIVVAVLDEKFEATQSWKRLYSMNPDAVVFMDLERDQAPRSFINRKLISEFSRIPSMVVSASHAKSLHNHMLGRRMKVIIEGKERTGNIQSIQCKLSGRSEQQVLICAHHDTHPFTPGATDNAAGVAIMLELARALAQQKPHLSYQFVSFGGEEPGMRGSWAFSSEEDLRNVGLCINLDSIGELPGMLLALSAGNDEMIEWVSRIAKENRYPAHCRRVSTSGGDNIVFAATGIPTIHLASLGITSGKVSHSPIDEPSLLTPYTLGELGRFASKLIEDLETRKTIPFAREVPQDLQQAARERIIDVLS